MSLYFIPFSVCLCLSNDLDTKNQTHVEFHLTTTKNAMWLTKVFFSLLPQKYTICQFHSKHMYHINKCSFVYIDVNLLRFIHFKNPSTKMVGCLIFVLSTRRKTIVSHVSSVARFFYANIFHYTITFVVL